MGFPFKTYSSPNNFGPMAQDANKRELQVASGIQTQDATGTPVTSPIAVPSSSVTTLNVPTNACRLHIIPLTNSVNISEVSNLATYVTAPVGVETVIPCARQSVIYLKSNTGAATGTTFYFDII
jgi:hypothetical protein